MDKEKERDIVLRNSAADRRKRFIINFLYFIILGGIFLFILKWFVPMFLPFIIGFLIAAVLAPLIKWIARKTGVKRNLVSIVSLLVFYGIMVSVILFFGSNIFSFIENIAGRLPKFYQDVIEPQLGLLAEMITTGLPEYQDFILQMSANLENTLQSGIMKVSTTLIGWGASWIVGFPAILIQMIFTVISSFFFTIDYDVIWNFILRQFKEEKRTMISEIATSARTIIWKILCVYALMMTITFVELYIGFRLLRMPLPLLLAFLIAIVDILPVLGTGTVLIPWAVILWIIGQPGLGAGIFILYLVITIVRQTLEPKVIGQQVGLHPIVTLLCIFAGAQLIGVLGIFTFPVVATIIKKMNDDGTIRLIK
jgi:sporulation integral membrane protein YtvI